MLGLFSLRRAETPAPQLHGEFPLPCTVRMSEEAGKSPSDFSLKTNPIPVYNLTSHFQEILRTHQSMPNDLVPGGIQCITGPEAT